MLKGCALSTGFDPETATLSPLLTGDRSSSLLFVRTTERPDVETILGMQGSRGLKIGEAVVVVVSHIQRIGYQPEKNYFTRWSSRSAEQGKKNKIKVCQRTPPPPPPPTPHAARSEKKKKITWSRIYRRYAGLGTSCVRIRIPSAHRLDQRVSLPQILRFRMR